MIVISDMNESLSCIKDIDNETFAFLKKQLSCYYPGYQFMPSYRAGMSDGKKHFYKVLGDTVVFPKGLAMLLYKSMQKKGIECKYDATSYNEVLPTESEFNDFVESLGLPFTPYDYQMKATFESIHRYRGVCQMATGSGKSLTQYILTRYFISKGMKVVILVPRIMLVEQMYSDFVSYGWNDVDDYVVKIGGDNKVKNFDAQVTLSTWQSLMNKPDIFRDVDVLMVDEAHSAGGSDTENIYEKVIFPASEGARYRLGFTGTVPKDAVAKMTLLGSLGSPIKYIGTRELIDRGLATPVEIKFIFFDYTDADKKIVKNLKYPDEVKFFNNHDNRNITLAKIINKVSGTGNTLVLVDNVSYGEELAMKIADLRGINTEAKELKKSDNPHKIYVINGSTKGKERENIRLLMEEGDGNIIIGTSSILSTGINIKNLHNLFLTSGGKSFIQLNQAIGRLLRLHKSKSLVKIWDIVDDCCVKGRSSTKKNHRYKHFEERLPIYEEHEYDTTEKVISIK